MAETTNNSSGLDPKVAGLLCWLFAPISSVIFLVVEKNDKSVKFHAWESLVTWGVLLVVYILITVVTLGCGSIFAWVIFLLMIVGAVKAYQGEMWKLPVVGDWAEKQASK